MPQRLRILAAVAIGGILGGLARYAITGSGQGPASGFPWPTYAVNVSGAFVLALLLVLVLDVLRPTTYLRPLLGTGFCGAYTTFSSVVVTTDQLAAHDRAGIAVAYLFGSLAGGLAAGVLGLGLGRTTAAAVHRSRS